MRTRALATAAASHADISASGATSTPVRKVTPISLANVEAQWTKLAEEEQAAVHEQLESLQVKDWKELSLDEKKAGE
jgi:cytochrome c oxidase subunit 4